MTAPNKNEGLIARLTAEVEFVRLDPMKPGGRGKRLRNPDGPEAARAIQDLEEVLIRARAFIDACAVESELTPNDSAENPCDLVLAIDACLASTADGEGSLRPSASVPAGAVIQGEGDRQERRE